ncbi:LptA/OstA family protein [Anaeromyxobacter oryzae]|uniref:Organic solvent tolerance-like N-terminal domain-containing protein n=1 Tax=Anaeromyxobacter oryzae TaxID=2918170 RepID=A0ABM7WUV7_9BACT|nr:LptA/OstA family protein [Anaeromyxobacter oryzae]BDG03283.1 hypothetical protein AMOR_22790 [Anaeromyxobacter oryzae]
MTLAVFAALAVLAGPGKPAAPAKARPPAARPVPAVADAPAAPPVHVDAAEFHYAPRRREVVFTGKPVTMTRDDARLTCLRLVAKNDERGEIVSAVCTGDVRFVRGERVVTCATATYENAAARVTCEGAPVVLHDAGTEAEGSRLVYDLATDEVQLKDAKVKMSGEEVEKRRAEYEERKKSRVQKPEARQ